MANYAKTALDYLPLDPYWHDNERIIMLENKYGTLASLIYIDTCLRCIRKEGYWVTFNDALVAALARDARCEEDKVRDAITCCLSIGLFMADALEKYGILTSARLWKTWVKAKDTHRRKIPKTAYESLFMGDKCTEIDIDDTEMPITVAKMPLSQAKPSKAKISKEPIPDIDTSTAVRSLVENWLAGMAFSKGTKGREIDVPECVSVIFEACRPDRAVDLTRLKRYLDEHKDRAPGDFGGRIRSLRAFVRPGGLFESDREQFSNYQGDLL
jgi:hypothetical protein